MGSSGGLCQLCDNPRRSRATQWLWTPIRRSRCDRANGLERVAYPVLGQFALVVGLQPGPEPLGHAEKSGQPQGSVGSDAPLAMGDRTDPGLWHGDGLRELVLGDLHRLEELL